MKNIDFKKLLVLIVIIVVAVLAIIGIAKIAKNIGGPNKETVKAVEELVKDYYVDLSYGNSSIYNGGDLLYDKDKVTFADLNKGSIIELAIDYATKTDKDIAINTAASAYFKKTYKVDGNGFNAKAIKEAVKELFGEDLELKTYFATPTYLYDYYYLDEFEAFFRTPSKTPNLNNENNFMSYYIVETKGSKKAPETVVAVAYVYYNGSNYTYAADKNGTKIVASGLEKNEFPKDKIDEFTKFVFKTKKVDDRYVFDSLEKVK